jgi:hypothetical protein
MKKLILGALIGIAVGYSCGYDDAESGVPPITTRALDKFGVSKVRDAQTAREKRQQDAGKQ